MEKQLWYQGVAQNGRGVERSAKAQRFSLLTRGTRPRPLRFWISLAVLGSSCLAADAPVRTANGLVTGAISSDGKIRIYKGIPFAAPPVGDLRWKPPQPAAAWEGVRPATEFGARCMQGRVFADMVFRDNGPSEDCLYLNVWTPAVSADERLPVMVWIYGGGFEAGATSEPRQDGEVLAHQGVLVVSVSYRLGLFGFLSYPELEKESPQQAAGNYGLLDQVAALKWVHDNIAAFGGDPGNVTIFGESAGSMSVSSLVATPLARGLFQRAIGESGGVTGLDPVPTKAEAEKTGMKFAQRMGAGTLKDLRAMPAQKLLKAALAAKNVRYWPDIDGYYFPESPWTIYSTGQQSQVALLAGWNQDERLYREVLGSDEPTPANYAAQLKQKYGGEATELLKYYPAGNPARVKLVAGALAGDRWIAYSTWQWLEFQVESGHSAVYRYHFEQAPPTPAGEPNRGVYHSADIEYVFGTLDWKKLRWTDADRKVSELMRTYWRNFAKSGDPNGANVEKWPAYNAGSQYEVMHLSPAPHAAADDLRPRYLYLAGVARGHREGTSASGTK